MCGGVGGVGGGGGKLSLSSWLFFGCVSCGTVHSKSSAEEIFKEEKPELAQREDAPVSQTR